jgi:hypothetical protein
MGGQPDGIVDLTLSVAYVALFLLIVTVTFVSLVRRRS